MLQLVSMSSCAFLDVYNFNLASWMSSMSQDIFLGYSCAQISILEQEVMALKVNWYPKITLHFLACNSLILALFDE
jgi:hypothetical protein